MLDSNVRNNSFIGITNAKSLNARTRGSKAQADALNTQNMNDFKLRGTCNGCKKTKWLISKRELTIPPKIKVLSKDLYCNKCFKSLKTTI